MPIKVNREEISEEKIQEEFDRLKPSYQSVFTDQTAEERNTELWEWAKENVIERSLLLQKAKTDTEKFPEDIYAYLKSLGFSFMQFIPCVETNPKSPTEAAPFLVTPEKYGEFLVKLFDLWNGDFVDGMPTTSIRFFDSLGKVAPRMVSVFPLI